MPDAQKIRETLAVARENIARLDMSSFARGKVNPDAADWRECGVAFCIADGAASSTVCVQWRTRTVTPLISSSTRMARSIPRQAGPRAA